jgi:diaminopimelate decarboxylase
LSEHARTTSLVTAPGAPDVVDLRRWCHGVVPLDAQIESWVTDVVGREVLPTWIDQFGSPLNVLATQPFIENIAALQQLAEARQIDLQVFFARKANKCLAFVDAALAQQAGIDCASQTELDQSLSRGVLSTDIICTAAVKDQLLLSRCIATGVTISVDNLDELRAIHAIAQSQRQVAKIAPRISGFHHAGQKLFSRFGFDVDRTDMLFAALRDEATTVMQIDGVHFHLDGYSADERISALDQSLRLVDVLRQMGHSIRFIDMGGGIPVCYLRKGTQWTRFWHEHRRALRGERSEVTYRNDPLGLAVVAGKVAGRPHCYPYFQTLTTTKWLAHILDASCHGETVADALRNRGLQLRVEPGRSVLNGAGITIARVEYRKQLPGGEWAIGLMMNGTQCQTSSEDFLVDPLLVPRCGVDRTVDTEGGDAMQGYLFGTYCTETDLILKRKLHFPYGVRMGDLIILPNTAGYLMHFRESRSHQFPLANNLVIDVQQFDYVLDGVDSGEDG